MPDNLTNHGENATLNLQPNTWWVKLHVGNPGEDGTANPAANTTRRSSVFGAAASGQRLNSDELVWTNVPSGETYSHCTLWDASTGGNCWWYGALTTPVAVTNGSNFRIQVGQLSVALG